MRAPRVRSRTSFERNRSRHGRGSRQRSLPRPAIIGVARTDLEQEVRDPFDHATGKEVYRKRLDRSPEGIDTDGASVAKMHREVGHTASRCDLAKEVYRSLLILVSHRCVSFAARVMPRPWTRARSPDRTRRMTFSGGSIPTSTVTRISTSSSLERARARRDP